MRTAVCISGQVRALDANLRTIVENLVIPSNADVFCHFWDSGPGGRERAEEAIARIEPKLFSISEQIDFTRFPGKGHTPRTRSQFYSVKQANNWKKVYEARNHFIYDFVIRTRLDLVIQNAFIPEEHKSEFSYARQKLVDLVPEGEFTWQDRPSSDALPGAGRFKFEDDMFFIANSANMDLYASAYDSIDEIISLAEHADLGHYKVDWAHALHGPCLGDVKDSGNAELHVVGENLLAYVQNKYLSHARIFVTDVPSSNVLAARGNEVW